MVSLSTIKRWCSRTHDLSDKRIFNHRPYDVDLDSRLIEYFKELREKSLPVTSEMLRQKALEFSAQEDFKASNGWG